MITEHFWYDTDREQLKYWGKNLSQCHPAHDKSHIKCLGKNPQFHCQKPGTNHHSRHGLKMLLVQTSLMHQRG